MSDDILKIIIAKVDNLDSKIDDISSNIVDIKITSARHEENLKEHMRRTSILEDSVEVLFEEIKPVKLHVHQVSGILKFIGIISSLGGAILGLLRFFKKI